MAEALIGPIYFRLLMSGEPLDDEFLERLAALVIDGAKGVSPSSGS